MLRRSGRAGAFFLFPLACLHFHVCGRHGVSDLYFFADRSAHSPIHRIDLATLKEEPLIENVMDRGISVTQRGLYFLRRHSDETTVTLNLFDPLVNREQELRKLFTKMNGGLEVRRDDRAALVTATEFMATDLMLVEDFQ